MNRAAGIFATPWFHRRFTLAPDGQYSTVTEVADWARAPYDELRKSLLLGNGDGAASSRVLLLAPVRHGDGTTTTAIMLAASLASTSRCLLLELNFRRPGVAGALGLTEYTAVCDLLHNGHGATVERAVVTTEVTNLFALPNQINGAVRSLPEVQSLTEIVRRLREQYDYIVIDAAPVLGYPDTPLLASVADGVLLIVAADSTPLDASLAARREIERSGACLLGAVITKQRRFVPEFISRRLGEN